jgi:hypothetical protein
LPAIIGKRLLHLGHVRKADHHRRAAGIHLIHQCDRLLLGLIQTRRRCIGGRHAPGRIDKKDETLAFKLRSAPARPQKRKRDNQNEQELQ